MHLSRSAIYRMCYICAVCQCLIQKGQTFCRSLALFPLVAGLLNWYSHYVDILPRSYLKQWLYSYRLWIKRIHAHSALWDFLKVWDLPKMLLGWIPCVKIFGKFPKKNCNSRKIIRQILLFGLQPQCSPAQLSGQTKH